MTQARWVLFAVLSSSFIVPFMGSAINLAIPAIGSEFGVPASRLSWVVSAYLLGSVAVLLPCGRLGDIVGRKRLYRIGTALFAVCTAAAGIAPTLETLIASRFLQGLATAMIFGTGMAILVSVHAPSERGKVIGISAASTYIGLSLGPMLGGAIAHYFGWRAIFYLTAAALALSWVAMGKVAEEWRGARGERFDFLGSALYMVGSPAVLYGCSSLADGASAWVILGGGVLALAAFVWRQARSDSPIFDVVLFRGNTVFAMSNLAAMINYSATFAIGFVISLYLQMIRGLDAPAAGLVLLTQPVLMALLSPKAGALSDRMEPRVVASIGMALNTVGLGFFVFLGNETPLWLICAVLVIIGAGFALFSSPNNNAIMGSVEPRYYGVAASTLAAMRLGGQAMSMAIVTLILTLYTSGADAPEQMLGAFRAAFFVFTILCALGVMASYARGEKVS